MRHSELTIRAAFVYLLTTWGNIAFTADHDMLIFPKFLVEDAKNNNCTQPNQHFMTREYDVDATTATFDPPYAIGFYDVMAGEEIHKRPTSLYSAVYWCKSANGKYQLRLWIDKNNSPPKNVYKIIKENRCPSVIMSEYGITTGIRIYSATVKLSDYRSIKDRSVNTDNSKKTTAEIYLSTGNLDMAVICHDGKWYSITID